MKMIKRIARILLVIYLLASVLTGCKLAENLAPDTLQNVPAENTTESQGSSSEPEYLGLWESSDGSYCVRIEVTLDYIIVSDNDNETSNVYGPYPYTVSIDSNYTYLEYIEQDCPVVFVLINQDMAAICPGDLANTSEFTAFTPSGVRYHANISNPRLHFRVGAGTTTLPEELKEKFAEWDISSDYLYYENAQVIAVPDYWGFPALAVTTDNELAGMEEITLVGFGNDFVAEAKGNFLIIDNT